MTPETQPEESHLWRRHFAAAANNRAWDLSEAAARSADEDTEMLDAAHAARFLWRGIGNESNAAHAEVLLAHVHALLGHGVSAMQHASAALAFFSNKPSLPWEIAFAHAVMANAAHASGNAELHRLHYREAAEAAEAIVVPESRRLFEATFRVVPKP